MILEYDFSHSQPGYKGKYYYSPLQLSVASCECLSGPCVTYYLCTVMSYSYVYTTKKESVSKCEVLGSCLSLNKRYVAGPSHVELNIDYMTRTNYVLHVSTGF